MNSSQGSTSSAILSQAILIKRIEGGKEGKGKERKGKGERNVSKGVKLSRASHSSLLGRRSLMSVNLAMHLNILTQRGVDQFHFGSPKPIGSSRSLTATPKSFHDFQWPYQQWICWLYEPSSVWELRYSLVSSSPFRNPSWDLEDVSSPTDD